MQPTLAAIYIYPFKSLDGAAVDSVRVLASGALENDRRFAFVDERGTLINGKGYAEMATIESRVDLTAMRIELQKRGDPTSMATFDLAGEADKLCDWMSDFLKRRVRLVEDALRGLPDDDVSPGPTVVSRATLLAVTAWFPGLDLDNARRRFRANLELADAPAFWEDRLSAKPPVRFTIGEVAFEGTNACQRCVVPALSPTTGEVWPDFARIFRARRMASLPAWSGIRADDHGYRLSANTQLAIGGRGGVIRVGQAVAIDPSHA